jgi:hypothetical protein
VSSRHMPPRRDAPRRLAQDGSRGRHDRPLPAATLRQGADAAPVIRALVRRSATRSWHDDLAYAEHLFALGT